MALFAQFLSWSNIAWNRNFCDSAAWDLRIGKSAFIARLASMSLLWQMSFRSRKSCHRSPAKSCSRCWRAVAPWLIVFGRQAPGFGNCVDLAQSSVARIVALGCRVPSAGKTIFLRERIVELCVDLVKIRDIILFRGSKSPKKTYKSFLISKMGGMLDSVSDGFEATWG